MQLPLHYVIVIQIIVLNNCQSGLRWVESVGVKWSEYKTILSLRLKKKNSNK